MHFAAPGMIRCPCTLTVRLTLEISEFKVIRYIRSNGVKSSTTQHRKALGWNVGLVVGLNARLTFKGVNLAGGGPHCLKVEFSHSSSRDDPDHGAAPDSAVATPYHLLSHPLSFSVRPWGTSWPTRRLAKLCSLSVLASSLHYMCKLFCLLQLQKKVNCDSRGHFMISSLLRVSK